VASVAGYLFAYYGVCWIRGCFCQVSFAGIYEIIPYPGPRVVCVVGSGYTVFSAGSKQSLLYNAFCSGVWCGISVAFVGDAIAGEDEKENNVTFGNQNRLFLA